ncbi:MAG: glycosyltransferase family 2 protein [Chitinophagaceae bacterium]|nr:MAG: glycosyltransferase family 2 protein [Chitinophagaceae bacterium]
MSNPDQPFVSVITPFLNNSEWLSEAVESVLAQTYTNFELILVNDGSAIETSVLALDYSDRYECIIYTEHNNRKNLGASASRNRGAKLAKGQYLAFLDSDDIWLPAKLEKQISLFQIQPSAEVICEASIFWYSWLDKNMNDETVYLGAPGDRSYLPGQLISFLYPFSLGAPPCPTGVILTKACFERVGGFEEIFRHPYQLYEDQGLLSKLYMEATVYISSQANNMYRKRENSLTSEASNEQNYKMVREFFFDWFNSRYPGIIL